MLLIPYLEDFATPIWPDVQLTEDSLLGDNVAIYLLSPFFANIFKCPY